MRLSEAIKDYHHSRLGLWEHQKNALTVWESKESLALFFEMGCGKTRTALMMLLQKIIGNKSKLEGVIFCPKIMMEGWRREAEAILPLEIATSFIILEGSQKDRIAKLNRYSAPKIYVTNIESLGMKDLMLELVKKDVKFLIVDESHKLKDPSGVRSKAIRQLADTIKYKIILSGSPVLNDYIDIWSQLRILGEKIVGNSFFKWRLNHFYNANANKTWVNFPAWVIKPESVKVLENLISEHAIVAKKKDVMKHLPPLVRKEIYVDLEGPLLKSYKEMERHFVTELGDQVVSADLVITKMLRLQQLCCGIAKGEETIATVKTAKHEALRELLEEICTEHKVIVWANFIHSLDDIAAICDDIGLHWVCIRGGQTNKERQEAVDSFNTEKKIRVCIGNPQAGGVGIGLQAASYMIYFSKSHQLELDIQSEARNHRGGSEVHTSITRIDLITRGTIEENIHQALREKMKLGDIIKGVKERWT